MRSWHALYPAGIAGGGLLLLRLSVASSLFLLSIAKSDAANWIQFLAILAALGVCAGVQTRVLAGLSIAAPIVALAVTSAPFSLAALHMIDALALALTGPGAWSADAVVFGRRKLVLPNRNDTIV